MMGVSFSMLKWNADSIILRTKTLITVMTRADYSDDECNMKRWSSAC